MERSPSQIDPRRPGLIDVAATAGQRHEVRIVEGPYAYAQCSCGWCGTGRRLWDNARREAREHMRQADAARSGVVIDLTRASRHRQHPRDGA
jgi:hypothetical protein